MCELYDGIDDERPLGKDRVVVFDNINYTFKEVLENMAISPERKIVLSDSNTSLGIISLSDIFKILK
jgi:hypothetical protein